MAGDPTIKIAFDSSGKPDRIYKQFRAGGEMAFAWDKKNKKLVVAAKVRPWPEKTELVSAYKQAAAIFRGAGEPPVA